MAEVVKIDKELMKNIEEFLKSNKYQYSSKKQIVNMAIIEFLNKRKLKEKKTIKK